MLLTIVGMPGTGKSLIAEYISRVHGFDVVYFGGVVLEEVRKLRLEITPENERRVRETLRTNYGMGAIAAISFPKIDLLLSQGKNVIVDGLYSTAEYEYIHSNVQSKFFSLACHSNKKIRYDRLSKRKIRPLTQKEVDERDLKEIGNLDKAQPIVLADFHLVNNGSLDELHIQIDKILSEVNN